MKAGIFPDTVSQKEALEKIAASPPMEGAPGLALQATCKNPFDFSNSELSPVAPKGMSGENLPRAVLDFGVKKNILARIGQKGSK